MAKDKQIARLLKADISMTSDLSAIAKMLEKKGRGGDTMLAHITRREAEMLKDMGGAGTVNPETGLLEFYDGDTAFAADNIDVGGGYNVATGAGDVPTSQAAAETGVTPGPSWGGGIKVATPSADAYSAYGTGQTLPSDVAIEPTYSGAMTSYISPYGTGLTPVSLTGGTDYGITQPGVVSSGAPALEAQGQTATPITTPAAPAPQEKSFLENLTSKLSTQDMIRLGLAGGLGIMGMRQAKKGQEQADEAKAEQQALAAPYQQQGQAMVGAAQRGELTPTGQQSLQAMQARLAQGVEQRGGVGAAQAAGQAEAFRQQLLQQQYDYGLKVSNIGDQLALGAIKTGMQADQALQQASTNFYTQLAAISAGIPIVRGQ